MRIIVLASFLVFATQARAADYTVSPTGDDSADGSAAHPWKTLQHAADQSQAGDTVTALAGNYVGFQIGFDTRKSGSAGMPITFKGMSGAIINAPNAKTADGIDLEAASYVTIDGFEVTGVSRAGIRTVSDGTTNSVNVTIQNCNTHDNGMWGILTSHIDHLQILNNTASKTMVQHGIYVSNACIDPIVRGNVIFGNNSSGLHMNGDGSQGGNGIIVGALVEKNIIYSNGAAGGSGINCDGVQMSTIQNNVVYDEHASGISLYVSDAAQPAINNVVVNNTVSVASDGRWAVNIQNASTGNTVLNNILLNNDTKYGAIDISSDSLTGFTSDYNVVTGEFTVDDNGNLALAAWQSMQNQDKHSLAATAAQLFVSATDFHLLAGAPAIGKGTTTHAPADDLDGNARGSSIDVGAYQYCMGCKNPDAGAGGMGGSDGGAGGGGSMSDMAQAGGGGTLPVDKASGCKCDVGGAGGGVNAGAIAIALLFLALARRRRAR